MKSYEISLKTRRVNGCETVEVTTTAEIRLDDNVKMSEITRFLSAARRIWKRAMWNGERNFHYELEVTESAYDGWNTDAELKQKEFNRWHGTEEEQDENGIYLLPDTRYTENGIYLTTEDMGFPF